MKSSVLINEVPSKGFLMIYFPRMREIKSSTKKNHFIIHKYSVSNG